MAIPPRIARTSPIGVLITHLGNVAHQIKVLRAQVKALGDGNYTETASTQLDTAEFEVALASEWLRVGEEKQLSDLIPSPADSAGADFTEAEFREASIRA